MTGVCNEFETPNPTFLPEPRISIGAPRIEATPQRMWIIRRHTVVRQRIHIRPFSDLRLKLIPHLLQPGRVLKQLHGRLRHHFSRVHHPFVTDSHPAGSHNAPRVPETLVGQQVVENTNWVIQLTSHISRTGHHLTDISRFPHL